MNLHGKKEVTEAYDPNKYDKPKTGGKPSKRLLKEKQCTKLEQSKL